MAAAFIGRQIFDGDLVGRIGATAAGDCGDTGGGLGPQPSIINAAAATADLKTAARRFRKTSPPSLTAAAICLTGSQR